jgi:hypothetical protein
MPTETITNTAQDEVLFISNRSPELRLVREHRVSEYGAAGQHIGDTQGKRYDFRDHQLRVRPGQDVLKDGPADPETGERTPQDALTWLRSHPAFNGGEANAFHEHGNEVGKVPDAGPVLDRITSLAIYGDVQGIEDLIAEERETWGRETVLERAQAALDSVSAAKEAIDQAEAGVAPENG